MVYKSLSSSQMQAQGWEGMVYTTKKMIRAIVIRIRVWNEVIKDIKFSWYEEYMWKMSVNTLHYMNVHV